MSIVLRLLSLFLKTLLNSVILGKWNELFSLSIVRKFEYINVIQLFLCLELHTCFSNSLVLFFNFYCYSLRTLSKFDYIPKIELFLSWISEKVKKILYRVSISFVIRIEAYQLYRTSKRYKSSPNFEYTSYLRDPWKSIVPLILFRPSQNTITPYKRFVKYSLYLRNRDK